MRLHDVLLFPTTPTTAFNIGEIDVLKNEVKDADLQKLMLAVLTDDEDALDPKD